MVTSSRDPSLIGCCTFVLGAKHVGTLKIFTYAWIAFLSWFYNGFLQVQLLSLLIKWSFRTTLWKRSASLAFVFEYCWSRVGHIWFEGDLFPLAVLDHL